jgi:D-3-phosphoglycerate dehydrogenase / 2-oxoglutarate reductase
MYTIKTLNAISPVGLAKLPKNQFDVTVDADAPDGILVRSADLLNTTFNDNLLAIARAGAGVNNIPLERCSEQGIVVFNTPGANANAVAELVIGMLIAGSRNVAAAAQWCQGLAGDPAMAKSVEKGKKQFVGNEIKGKTLGVIGLGAIGSRVANCAIELGMEVYGYDPYISIEAAWNLSSQVHHCVKENSLSQNLMVLPAPSERETLAGTPSVLPLRVKPHSPFCRCATSSPGAGEVFPQRESQEH